MKISTKSRYGLRALVDLAVHSAGEQVPLISIAERQNLSVNYLEQVFSLLKKANIVKSIKGSQGGYILGRAPEIITVEDIIRAIEGEILFVDEDAMPGEGSMIYQNMQACLQRQVWDKMTKSVREVISGISLADLVKQYQSMHQESPLMYYI